MKKFVYMLIAAFAVLALSGCDQYIARAYGGKIDYQLPAGAQLVNMTWKDTSLWVLYYEPATKQCVFAESSAVGALNGQVVVPNCNPMALAK